MRAFIFAILLPLISLLLPGVANAWQAAPAHVGLARVDITPAYPIRLNGFGFRRAESEGVTQKIWIKALALGGPGRPPAVLLAIDSLGLPDSLVQKVARTLKEKAGLEPERFVITFSHSHTTPMIAGACPTIFSSPIPPEHQKHIDQYTQQMEGWMIQAAMEALADRKPATLHHAVGKVGFAANRRTKGGPVDHDLPLLVIRNPDGGLRGLYASYACHCVTLSHNHISGDWAGYAQEALEKDHPGSVALISIGCGADANPSSGVTGDKVAAAAGQGRQIADEVARLLKTPLRPITGELTTKYARIQLPFAPHPARAEWEKRAAGTGASAYHAKVQLQKLDAGQALRTAVDYPVQTWFFGDDLAILFLSGEVVVDYALRFKKDFDPSRFWINGYSNDFPCYIPSERILKEGGYEGGGAMVYFDQPGPLATGVEQKIVDEVHRQIPDSFRNKHGRTDSIPPLSPALSLAAIRLTPGFRAELVAAEPLVEDPVAIEFGPDGRLWVAEMRDYPLGMDGNHKPGGRVKVLTDTDGDGRYDKATIFLDNLPYPTGLTLWRGGLLVCVAPDVLYAEDRDGDGKADHVVKALTGFATHNFQARVNGLRIGLDHWLYASAGLFGGTITTSKGRSINLGARDFRFDPDGGRIEPVSGLSQQGRVRDDFGDWFGCDNSNLIRQVVMPEHYLRRNPHLPPPGDITVNVAADPGANQLFPASGQLVRFALSGQHGQVTAACGLEIYRDTLLGPGFTGNSFICEPVSQVVHRLQLKREGTRYAGHRAPEERASEFLASTDNWFRPVQARTGPDGALWVVDMYRYVIEHPRWIPPQRLAELDVRAGQGMGRIYRILPVAASPRTTPRLDKLDTPALAAALDSPNGTLRDLIHQMLLWRADPSCTPVLEKLLESSPDPAVRLEALCLLDGVGKIETRHLLHALKDQEPRVLRHAIRLCEGRLEKDEALAGAFLAAADQTDPMSLQQFAFTLGQWSDPRAGAALAQFMVKHLNSPHLRAAALSSLVPHQAAVAQALADPKIDRQALASLYPQLLDTAGGSRNLPALLTLFEVGQKQPDSFAFAAQFLQSIDRHGLKLQELLSATAAPGVADRYSQLLQNTLQAARRIAADSHQPLAQRRQAVELLGLDPASRQADVALLISLLVNLEQRPLHVEALSALARLPDVAIAGRLLDHIASFEPSTRSRAMDALLARPTWTAELLNRAAKTPELLASLDAARRQMLLTHADPAIRSQAAGLIGALQLARQPVLDRYQPALTMASSASRGQEVFARVCVACHQWRGVGQAIGPDIAQVTDRSPQGLLVAILDPNRAINDQFVTYTLALTDGRVLAGMITGQSDSGIKLRQLDGSELSFARSQIKSLTSTGRSLMPEGLEAVIDPQQMADLLDYLRTPDLPLKILPGNTPGPIAQEPTGRIHLPATHAEIRGHNITFELDQFRNIGYWQGYDDHVRWKFTVGKPGLYDLWLDAACNGDSAGNDFRLEIGGRSFLASMPSTGGWNQYRALRAATLDLQAGEHALLIKPDGKALRNALMDLRGVILLPKDAPPPAGLVPQPLSAHSGLKAPPVALPTDPAAIGAALLAPDLTPAIKESLIKRSSGRAGAVITALTQSLSAADLKEEYRRIPTIWRIAIDAGKANSGPELLGLLGASLPLDGQPLRHWQSVVIGGGVINGLTQANQWPGPRIAEILKDHPDLLKRLDGSIDLASTMADDEKVPHGTRYDALRMLGIQPLARRGPQLERHLVRGVHDELQMGAISALGDIDDPAVPMKLLAGFDHYSAQNRKLALDALIRTPGRAAALLDAVQTGRIKPADLGADRAKKLRGSQDPALRARAEKLLPQ